MKKTRQKKTETPASEGFSFVVRAVSEEEIIAAEKQRKTEEGYFYMDEVDGFTYPTFFTAAFDYGATGEGMTTGITISLASNAAQLRTLIDEEFGPYFRPCVQVWPMLVIPPKFGSLLSEWIRNVIEKYPEGRFPGYLKYTSLCHVNMS